jgi:hypothetical protein
MRDTRRRRPDPHPQAFLSAVPKPYRGKITPTPEEFAAWAQHPVTEWVAARYMAMAGACREAWIEESWRKGLADEKMLLALRTRADCYSAFTETTYERYLEIDPKE